MTPIGPEPPRFATDAVLYSFRRCPYAMRARMALAVSGADPELREVVLARKPAQMLASGTMATVPLVVLSSGAALEQSIEIMDWCLGESDPRGWLHVRDDADLCALVGVNDGPFKQAVDRYKYPQRYGRERDDEAAHAAADCLEALERLLSSSYLAGDSPGFFDVALFPFVRQFAAVNETWFLGLPLPNVQGWRARFVVHRVFTSVMRKLPPWTPDADPLRFRASLV